MQRKTSQKQIYISWYLFDSRCSLQRSILSNCRIESKFCVESEYSRCQWSYKASTECTSERLSRTVADATPHNRLVH